MNVIMTESKNIQSAVELDEKESLSLIKSIKDEVALCIKQLNEIRTLKVIK